MIRIEIGGLPRLLTMLRRLRDPKLAGKILRKSLRAAAAVINKIARRIVPRKTGELKKSLFVKVQAYRRTKRVVALIGPRRDRFYFRGNKLVNPSRYAHLAHRKLAYITNAVKQGAEAAKSAMISKCKAEILANAR